MSYRTASKALWIMGVIAVVTYLALLLIVLTPTQGAAIIVNVEVPSSSPTPEYTPAPTQSPDLPLFPVSETER